MVFGNLILSNLVSNAHSAIQEVERLIAKCGLMKGSRLLDLGSGNGRLATGLLILKDQILPLQYLGLDVNNATVDWCQGNLSAQHECLKFAHINVRNEFSLPLPSASQDVINLYSVFSHMTEADLVFYLRERKRVLASAGRIFCTAFVEQDVPDYEINPASVLPGGCRGALHVVRNCTPFTGATTSTRGIEGKGFPRVDRCVPG